jgi:hypothetical protein
MPLIIMEAVRANVPSGFDGCNELLVEIAGEDAVTT